MPWCSGLPRCILLQLIICCISRLRHFAYAGEPLAAEGPGALLHVCSTCSACSTEPGCAQAGCKALHSQTQAQQGEAPAPVVQFCDQIQ